MTNRATDFSSNVFINCPYDSEYKPLLRALIFTVIDCRFKPRLASESSDSGEVTIEKIKSLIKESCYSIHDISRMEQKGKTGLPRFNMPFELGLDIGCKTFSANELCNKKCLVLERDRYRYKRALSDISGNEIKAHGNDAQKIVRSVRNWICENIDTDVLSATRIWQRYNEFYGDFEVLMKEGGFSRKDIKDMPDSEFIGFITKWKRSH